jgi:hypothetical protein
VAGATGLEPASYCVTGRRATLRQRAVYTGAILLAWNSSIAWFSLRAGDEQLGINSTWTKKALTRTSDCTAARHSVPLEITLGLSAISQADGAPTDTRAIGGYKEHTL